MTTPEESITPSTETLNPTPSTTTTTTETAETNPIKTATLSPTLSDCGGVKRKRGDEDPKPAGVHPLHKTSLCSYFRRNSSGECSHGDSCRFAHSESELRPRPDGSWDPTSDRAKKLARRGDEEEEENEAEEEESSVMMTDVLCDTGADAELSKCLVHLPRKWNSEQLKSFLDQQGVNFKLAKKKKGMSVGFLTFEDAEQVKTTTEVLDGKPVNNRKLKVGDVIPRSYDDKIKAAQKRYQPGQPGVVYEMEATTVSNDGENGEEANGSISKEKCARDAVTPLADIPYAEQLEQKSKSLMHILKKLTRNARKACPSGVPFPEWVLKSREIGGLACKLEGIIGSPLVNGYRNKCEFSVGYSVQGKPTVGFMLGNFREGVTAVEEPTSCPNVSRIACSHALLFQQFLQDSALPVWNRFNNTGFWRQLTVREGRKPQDAKVQDHEINIVEVMLIIQDHKGISNAAPADAPLHLLPISESISEAEKVDAVCEARIHDYIGNLRFSISPTAFFQVNTLAAEKLYSLAGDWAGLGPDTLLFDVCCGTGTIGLTLANRVGMVVGIEMNASAVSDAEKNAEINGITNCKFICGKAEDVMGSLLREYSEQQYDTSELSEKSETDEERVENGITLLNNKLGPEKGLNEELKESGDASGSTSTEDMTNSAQKTTTEDGNVKTQQFKNVVAIVDPPRSGLHPIVLKALRTHARLKRLVYISCNPETLMANAIELCTPSSENNEKGANKGRAWKHISNAGLARHRLKSMPMSEPFQPVKAMAVDLFPHTPHCELVMLLER
ncbi:zinc finger CCCH domain-containing protein 24 isoform X2 [Silene latifolia]|uniref:zinc finger CCCH domain-containing protein 24 isoform X2 n=1 Tax=Silene latifolia TaxID=37657 RepID=UPI003D782632